MNVKILDVKGTWRNVADAARTTIGMNAGDKEPTPEWRKRILLAEHSPIRKLIISWKWYDLLSWVSVHFVRHKFGIEHWVRSQRTDRTNVNRNKLKQSELIEHECEANAQAIINISRKRLCKNASPETREAWVTFLNSIATKEPELYSVCVPDCIYRGWCYEYKSCGYHLTKEYKEHLNEYRKNINKWGEQMSNDQNLDLAYFQMNMLQAEIAMNAMIAENKQREILGQSMAYTEKAFMNLIDEYQIHHNAFPFYTGR